MKWGCGRGWSRWTPRTSLCRRGAPAALLPRRIFSTSQSFHPANFRSQPSPLSAYFYPLYSILLSNLLKYSPCRLDMRKYYDCIQINWDNFITRPFRLAQQKSLIAERTAGRKTNFRVLPMYKARIHKKYKRQKAENLISDESGVVLWVDLIKMAKVAWVSTRDGPCHGTWTAGRM